MKDMQVHEVLGDLREEGIIERKEEIMDQEVSRERSRDSNDPLEVDIADEDSIFYGDFPSLPDFTCISSSSSTSSSSALPTRSTSSSSASSAWAVLKTDREGVGDMLEDYNGDASAAQPLDGVPPSDVDGIDVLDEIAEMGILDDTDIWDPATLFPDEEENNDYGARVGGQGNPNCYHGDDPDPVPVREEDQKPSEDLAMVFFEWLKTNKESISPEDLRSIKLKRSTIECAAKRLGGGKEGMKQLLKLILAWVQNHHLQKRRNNNVYREVEEMNHNISNNNNCGFQYQGHSFPSQHVPVPVSNGNPTMDSCFSPSWMHPAPYLTTDPARNPGGYPPMMGYMGAVAAASTTPSSEYHHVMDPNTGWSTQFPQYGGAGYATTEAGPPAAAAATPAYVGFGNNYAPGYTKMASSATKEARKKRMARQRRLFTHHHHHNHHHHHHHGRHHGHQHTSRLAGDGATCTNSAQSAAAAQGNWVLYNPSAAPATAGFHQSMVAPDGVAHADATTAMQPRQIDRRQGWKSEKNLRFLLQKVLKQSDVGNLGRIVLPKKEAETHLPELDARDGIAIQMEDIGTSRVWNMRYRYWPNNKSRMYLLENTGDFVRSNGLQEGDFIVIYSDAKCSKYMIRGVKVRKPELKPDTTKGPVVKAAKNFNSTGTTTATGATGATGATEGISPTSQQNGI